MTRSDSERVETAKTRCTSTMCTTDFRIVTRACSPARRKNPRKYTCTVRSMTYDGPPMFYFSFFSPCPSRREKYIVFDRYQCAPLFQLLPLVAYASRTCKEYHMTMTNSLRCYVMQESLSHSGSLCLSDRSRPFCSVLGNKQPLAPAR